MTCFLRDAFGVCPARFGVLFCSVMLGCAAAAPHPKLLDRVVSDSAVFRANTSADSCHL